MRATARLPREARLRQPSSFATALKKGRRVEGRLLTMVVHRRGAGVSRLGLAASRRIGGAVERNRAKRLGREAFRRKRPVGPGWEIVLIFKVAAARAKQVEVDREYAELLGRLVGGRSARPRDTPGHPRD